MSKIEPMTDEEAKRLMTAYGSIGKVVKSSIASRNALDKAEAACRESLTEKNVAELRAQHLRIAKSCDDLYAVLPQIQDQEDAERLQMLVSIELGNIMMMFNTILAGIHSQRIFLKYDKPPHLIAIQEAYALLERYGQKG